MGELLWAAPGLKVLATSHAPSRLYGEQQFAATRFAVEHGLL